MTVTRREVVLTGKPSCGNVAPGVDGKGFLDRPGVNGLERAGQRREGRR